MQNSFNLTFYHSLGKFSSQKTDDIFLFFQENRIRHFMQIVSIGDNLHEMSKPVFWGKKEEIFQNVIC